MLHFNELYISEDNKHIVIDVEIDDFNAYDSCYIDTITVDTADDYCNNEKSKSVTVYQNKGYTVQLDMNHDGKITDVDCYMYNRLIELISKLTTDDEETYSHYDVNRDGVVDLKDLDALINAVTYSRFIDGYQYDVNSDDEVNIGDVNALIDYLLELGQNCLTPDELEELRGLLTDYQTAARIKTEDVKRHVGLCLTWCDIVELIGIKGSFDKQMFVVTATAYCDGSIGTTAKEMGCGWDNNVITGVAVNTKPIYDSAVQYASAYGDKCDTGSTSAFEDFVLRYYAFDFALKTGDICQAWYYFSNYLNGMSVSKSNGHFHGCGCHGTYW